jgi:MHS family proline/betaine transporter-like MFS transporter
MEGGQRKAVTAAAIGNFVELFDFTVFGFFAVTIGRQFFPNSSPVGSLLGSFATFGVGFLMRPAGAFILASIGDRYGRKRLLAITMTFMVVAAAGITIVPPYSAIGVWAPILLLLFRLLQGFATGGEWGGAVTMIVEYASPGRRGFIGSFQQVGFGLGTVAGTLAALIVNSVSGGSPAHQWAWRIPFALGCVIGPIGIYIRNKVEESPEFRAEKARNRVPATPIRDALTQHWRQILTVVGIGTMGTAAGYIANQFMSAFASSKLGIDSGDVSLFVLIGSIVQTLLIPFWGMVSDRVGRRPVLLWSAVAYLVLIYPLFMLLVRAPSVATLALTQLVASVLIAMSFGPLPAALAELFPAEVRTTALSIGYSLAVALFGGFAPFVSTLLVQWTGNLISPTYFAMFCALITVITTSVAAFQPDHARVMDEHLVEAMS